jgi:uncharacterized OB-fold protein
VAPADVSGEGMIRALTVNHHPWAPDDEPYVVIIVELDEQPGLLLVSNLVGMGDESLIGSRVGVTFEALGAAWLPLFAPIEPG